MDEFDVTITETLVRRVRLQAECAQDALDWVEDQYCAGRIVLNADDFDGNPTIKVEPAGTP